MYPHRLQKMHHWFFMDLVQCQLLGHQHHKLSCSMRYTFPHDPTLVISKERGNYVDTIEVFSNLTVSHWAFVPYDFPSAVLHIKIIISFCLWCMLGGTVRIWVKWRVIFFGSFQHLLACRDEFWTSIKQYGIFLVLTPDHWRSCMQIINFWPCWVEEELYYMSHFDSGMPKCTYCI